MLTNLKLLGKMLALGYSDGSTRIYDVNNGKQIHRLTSEASSFGMVTCVGWVDNHSQSRLPTQAPEAKSTECTPQALFDMDVGQMLPRLSVLPSSSGQYEHYLLVFLSFFSSKAYRVDE